MNGAIVIKIKEYSAEVKNYIACHECSKITDGENYFIFAPR